MSFEFADRLLETGVGRQLKRAIPAGLRARLRDSLVTWRRDRNIARSLDRAILTDIIIPALADAHAFAYGADVLWIGCRRYTKGYYRLIERQGARCWTIDIDPDLRRWGRRGRHVVGTMLELDLLFPGLRFDVVLCNGVFGFGVNTRSEQEKASAAMGSVIKPAGWLLLGWNTGRIRDPLEEKVLCPSFEPSCLPGFGTRKVVEGCTHVFDILRRCSDVG